MAIAARKRRRIQTAPVASRLRARHLAPRSWESTATAEPQSARRRGTCADGGILANLASRAYVFEQAIKGTHVIMLVGEHLWLDEEFTGNCSKFQQECRPSMPKQDYRLRQIIAATSEGSSHWVSTTKRARGWILQLQSLSWW